LKKYNQHGADVIWSEPVMKRYRLSSEYAKNPSLVVKSKSMTAEEIDFNEMWSFWVWNS
jgi:L-lactate utilization protein LutB